MKDEEKTREQLINELNQLRLQLDREKLNRPDNCLKKCIFEQCGKYKKSCGQLDLEVTDPMQAEKKFNCFFELSVDIFLVADFDGNIKRVNAAFEKILGYTKEETLGKLIIEFVYKEDIHRHNVKKLKLIADSSPGIANHIGRYLCKDGSYKWLEWNAVPVNSERLVYAVARDITDRKEMEKEISKKNQQITNILESITDSFYVLDKQWRFIYANKEAQRLLSITDDELIGKTIWEVIPENIIKEFCNAVSGQVPVHFEMKCPYYGQWFGVEAYPSQGGLSVYSRDITKRKYTEKELKLSESRLKALLKLSQMTEKNLAKVTDFIYKEGIRLTESDIGFLGMVNQDETMVTTYAWTEKIMNECTIEDKSFDFPVENAGLWGEAIRQRRTIIVNDYPAPNPFKKGFPPGHVTLSRVMIVPIFEGKRIVMLAVVANKQEEYNDSDAIQLELLMSGTWKIMQRKQVEESLRLSEERFYKAFHGSPISMSINSLENHKFIDVNETFTQYTGYSRNDAIGRTPLELNLWKEPEKRDNMLDLFYKQQKFSNLEVRIRAKSGEERLFLISGEAITVNNEKCLLVVSQDITEYKQMENEIARFDRLNLIGEMAASIGHEIRNPMTTVRGFLQLLGGKHELACHKEYFDLMIEELDRANSIITEFLSLSKSKSIELKRVNINNIINNIFPLIKANALENDRQVEIELSNIPDLYLDEKEIRQLILNFVRNGLEATPNSGILTIKTFTDGSDAVLAVQDQGAGIPPEVLEKIGTPFLSTKVNGTGLGLAVCYSIAARHNAKIEIKTSAEGTTFSVIFKVK